ncbi:XRE family transcriptional regulator [Rhodospirillaceae bacterium SYSU D60014]|uniref:helix-turn-helix domain-containing protein n=1 Tax=Virgifigura deserti TaxID=2268457 RepID=UPI0013C508EF
MEMLPHDLGDRIRRLRRQQNVTLAELSERSGVPLSTLSKIENAQVKKTSADNLFKIARGLSVLFDTLVERRPVATVAAGRRVITRGPSAEGYCTEIYDYFAHSTDLLKKRMVPLRIHVKTRDIPELQDWSHHDGEEWVFVSKGAIDLHTEHYAPVRLEEGDSAYFDSAMRHCYVNAGKGVADILSVCLAGDALGFAERGARLVVAGEEGVASEERTQDEDPAPA